MQNIESLKVNAGQEVNRMLVRLESRIVDKKPVESVLSAIGAAKNRLDSTFDFKTADAARIAELTNPWTAWGKNGVFDSATDKSQRVELQNILKPNSSSSDRYARQMWRTEMVSYFAEKLQKSGRADAPDVMEKIMAAQKVTELGNDPVEALRGAMHLDPAIKDKKVREVLAANMKKGVYGTVDTIPTLFGNHKVISVKVVSGGDYVEIPMGLTKNFEFKNMFFEEGEGRIYAQMKNGCEGNLVMIEVGKIDEPVKPPVTPPVGPRGADPEVSPAPSIRGPTGSDSEVQSPLRGPAGRTSPVAEPNIPVPAGEEKDSSVQKNKPPPIKNIPSDRIEINPDNLE